MGDMVHNLAKSGLFGLAGFGLAKAQESQDNKAMKATNAANAATQAIADKTAAEQKALQDTQEEDKKKASARLAASTSGFSSGANTARSFLTTF